MSFQLESEESLGKSLRRIVGHLMESILEELTGKNKGSRDEAVHEARKSLKKLRAVLRLVRPVIAEKTYRCENTCFRDAGRPLTEVRDAKILIETLDELVEHFHEHIAGRSFTKVREGLQENLRAVRKRVLEEHNAFTVVAESVSQAQDRFRGWTEVTDQWSSMGAGLKNTYRKARASLKEALVDPRVPKLHECRKQVKYLRYQLEILRPLWPERLEELAAEADRMSDLLGDDHDLAVLRQMLTHDQQSVADDSEREALLALIDRRRAELTQEALLLGEKFFQDRSRKVVRQLKGYWKMWRRQASTVADVILQAT